MNLCGCSIFIHDDDGGDGGDVAALSLNDLDQNCKICLIIRSSASTQALDQLSVSRSSV